MLKTTLAAAALSAALASPAFAVEAMKSMDVSAPPDKVWAMIGEFCSIGQWHPAVEKCQPSAKDGKTIRTLSLKGGGTIVEERTANNKMDYSYIILESPLPVADYKSTIAVKPSGNGSQVVWTGNFQAKGAPDAKAKEVIEGIYDAGLKSIADKAK